MASYTIVDEVFIDHKGASSRLHIALTENTPSYNPSCDPDELDNHHVSIAIRPTKEFCVWSVKSIYEGLDPNRKISFCSYCERKDDCNLLTCVSMPGINITQEELLKTPSKYKTERTTTHLCDECFGEILSSVEMLVEQNSAELAMSNL
jgi:hypothetical protein